MTVGRGGLRHKLSVELKIVGNIEKKKKTLHPNNSVKQQTIFKITTHTTCILKKTNKLYPKKPQNLYSKKRRRKDYNLINMC
jgi:hypothetical protein